MMEPERRDGWRTNLLLAAWVMATVILALVLAQLDALQERGRAPQAGLPIVNIQATAVAVGQIIPLNLNPEMPAPTAAAVLPVPDDRNPRPEFITGVGGGMVRDILLARVPNVLRTEIYATASLAGGAIVVGAHVWKLLPPSYAMSAGASFCIVLRCRASRYRWQIPVIRFKDAA